MSPASLMLGGRELYIYIYLTSDDSLYGADNRTAANVGIWISLFSPQAHCGFSRVDEV